MSCVFMLFYSMQDESVQPSQSETEVKEISQKVGLYILYKRSQVKWLAQSVKGWSVNRVTEI